MGKFFEYSAGAGVTTTYYFLGQRTIAMRQTSATTTTLYYLQGDHPLRCAAGTAGLGSASLTTDQSGNLVGLLRYWPWGGAVVVTGTMPTDRLFTGQRDGPLPSLHDYGARFFYGFTGQFLSQESIVPRPGDPQALNRYAYGLKAVQQEIARVIELTEDRTARKGYEIPTPNGSMSGRFSDVADLDVNGRTTSPMTH